MAAPVRIKCGAKELLCKLQREFLAHELHGFLRGLQAAFELGVFDGGEDFFEAGAGRVAAAMKASPVMIERGASNRGSACGYRC